VDDVTTRRAFFIDLKVTRGCGRPRAARRRRPEEATVVHFALAPGRDKPRARAGFAAILEPRMLIPMSPSRTFSPAPALGEAFFYAFFFYAVTSPADRMRT